MSIIFVAVLISVLLTINCTQNVTRKSNVDYCSHPGCALPGQHTLCAAGRGRASPRLFASGVTPWMRRQMLALHNRRRDAVALGLEPGQPPAANMRKLYWDAELERAAEAWARQCRPTHDQCRATLRFDVTQNVDVRPLAAWMTEPQLLGDAVDAWFSGARAFPPDLTRAYRPASCVKGCNSHWYAAAVWASTWRLGCSQALCTIRRRACSAHRRRRAPNATEKPYPPTRTTVKNFVRRTMLTTSTRQPLDEYATTKRGRSAVRRGGVADTRPMRRARVLAYTVCNYGPAGRTAGLPVYAAGAACAACPPATACVDRTHRALCTLLNDPDALPQKITDRF